MVGWMYRWLVGINRWLVGWLNVWKVGWMYR